MTLNEFLRIIILVLCIAPFFCELLIRVVEPFYMLVFNKPLYLYWYPLPKKVLSSQRLILENNFPFYVRLTAKNKTYFEHRLVQFLKKYEFIGKEIEITDEMKILIGASYVMLTFGLRDYLIGLFTKIIIYPSAYFSSVNEAYHKGEFNPRMKTVVFSWEDFMLGLNTNHDNVNLGLHEFTHVLHFHCLKSKESSAAIFQDEFVKVMQFFNEEDQFSLLFQKGYFREYAYQDQFEFLAVVLEHFFETPQEFKKAHPELFIRVSEMLNLRDESYL